MHNVYKPNKHTNTGPLDHRAFLLRYSAQSQCQGILPKEPYKEASRKQEILQLMGVNFHVNLEEVAAECSPDLLNGEIQEVAQMWSFQKSKFQHIPVNKEALKHKCVQKYEAVKKNSKFFSFQSWLKYRSERRIRCKETPKDAILDLVPGENLLFKIRMYHPFKHTVGLRGKSPPFFHSLIVLGSHTLKEFRDKIICTTEASSCVDMSENPDMTAITPKDLFKSGFIFMEDTFYNDMSNPSNVDYSQVIRDWAKGKPIDFGEFKTAVMADVTFSDLKLKLGYPYVYKHLGNCEHLFTFSDIEVLQPSDPCTSDVYPMYTSWSMKRTQYCHMCGKYIAKWCVVGSDRVPFDPAFFCESCFHSYNYVNGVKVGNFKAYSYMDSMCAL